MHEPHKQCTNYFVFINTNDNIIQMLSFDQKQDLWNSMSFYTGLAFNFPYIPADNR